MGYVIAGILVLAIVAAGVTLFMLRATRSRGEAAADRGHGAGIPGTDAAIVAPDEGTPLGDTDQHAGTQDRSGQTVDDPERSERGTPTGGGPAAADGGVGGEGEGSRPVVPESERLSNRAR